MTGPHPLVGFLHDRFDEDEYAAVVIVGHLTAEGAPPALLWAPQRIAADAQAKRVVVEQVTRGVGVNLGVPCPQTRILKALASAYADHDEYRAATEYTERGETVADPRPAPPPAT